MRASSISLAVGLIMLAGCGGNPVPAPIVQPGASGPGGFGAPGDIAGSRFGGPGSQGDLALVAGDRVFFRYDHSDISPEAEQILVRQAEWLTRYPNVSVTIEGHTDERGTREYNLSLGDHRAPAVRDVLVALGILAARIATISYGKERPVITHSDEQSYAQNRRAVTVVR